MLENPEKPDALPTLSKAFRDPSQLASYFSLDRMLHPQNSDASAFEQLLFLMRDGQKMI